MTIVEGTRRVLVADDDSAIREMLSVNLEMLGSSLPRWPTARTPCRSPARWPPS
jgi:CheY-like chemotaxis protein